jgi:hypothetical protein
MSKFDTYRMAASLRTLNTIEAMFRHERQRSINAHAALAQIEALLDSKVSVAFGLMEIRKELELCKVKDKEAAERYAREGAHVDASRYPDEVDSE